MGIGNLLLNWGVLVVGLFIFYFGCLFMVHYAREYKRHVIRSGRVSVGKKYGTSWDRADTLGVTGAVIFWIIFIPVVVGVLLFFFTGLVKIGVPLWIGCTLGIAGILLFFYALISGMGLAKRDVEIALRHKLEDEEQRQDDNSE